MARIRAGERIVRLETTLAAKVTQLQVAEGHVEQLQGILPICMLCHKIRNDDEKLGKKWETYIALPRSHAQFQSLLVHGLFFQTVSERNRLRLAPRRRALT